jgi:Replication initiator protein A
LLYDTVVPSSAWTRPRIRVTIRTPTMTPSTNDNEKPMNREEPERTTFDRLREEITILRIEGTLFCFDTKEAKRRAGIIRSTLSDADGTERPLSIDIHERYGQPSLLAYKIVQAIFLKMTGAGEPYTNVVAFTQRELARLVGKTWSGKTSGELRHAMLQLQSTRITCSIHNKEIKEYLEVNFIFLPTVLFSSKERSITECVVQVHDAIVSSLNRRHAIWLNNKKLMALDPVAAVFFKRLFQGFNGA